jgi:glucose/arabinose dehydrogenase
MLRRVLPFVLAALAIAPAIGAAGGKRRAVRPEPPLFCDFGSDVAGIGVPAGFCLRKFADVPTPRVLAFAPNGDVFVSSPSAQTPGGAPVGASSIFLLRQVSLASPPVRLTFASGSQFATVHGLLVRPDAVYFTTMDAVYMIPYATGETAARSEAPVRVADLTDDALSIRWTHSLAQGLDGSLYVSRGQFESSVCPPPNPQTGAVLRIASGNPKGDIVVRGMRDPLFLRCMPWGKCYAMELSGDGWTGIGGEEKLIELRDGDDVGYPCCIGRDTPNPEMTPTPDCSQTAPALHAFPLHDTPFGFDWERNGVWPGPYAGAFFVGLHGQFGSWRNAGLQWAPIDPATHLPTGSTTSFLTGVGRGGAINRVADVMFAPDGRLFFTDDQGGAIYWIAPRTLRRP